MNSWEEEARQILLEEEEEDDELFFILIPSILSAMQEEKRPVHTSSLPGAVKVREILEGHETWSKMASCGLKPGVPVILRELEPSSEMFKQGVSLRVTGNLHSYDVDSATAVIQDGSVSLKVDTQHLRDVSFRTNSMYQFIGELLIRPDNDGILQARIGRNVDGLDLNLYQQSLLILRQHEAKLRSSRRA